MLADERRQHILKLLNQRSSGAVSVVELADSLRVSEMTIRRDLDWLQDRGLARRVHGGAIASEGKPFHQRIDELSHEKRDIGWAAAHLVHDGERIILDAGTTTRQITPHLASRRNLTVLTTAVPIVQDLAQYPQITTIILGGLLKHAELCTVGPMVTRELERLSVDTVFLSTAGFDIEKGITEPDIHEAEVKEAMIQAAARVVLVADSSKWQKINLARIASLDVVDVLVTDDSLPANAIAAIEGEGIRIVMPTRIKSGVASTIDRGEPNAQG